MISFTPSGVAEVHFRILGSSGQMHRRCELRMSLDEFLVLVRTAETLEELRIALFDFNRKHGGSRAHAKGAGQ